MALTNLAGTKWRLNDTLDAKYTGIGFKKIIAFSSNNKALTRILNSVSYYGSLEVWSINIKGDLVGNTTIYNTRDGWIDIQYKELFFAGGEAVEDADLIAWLQANATQIPTINLQEKTVSPSNSEQEIVADSGYDSLSKVVVSPIADDNLLPKNIKKNVSILNVVGTYERANEPNLTPNNIKKGVRIYDVYGAFEGFAEEPSESVKSVEVYRDKLLTELQVLYGNEPNTERKLTALIENAESRVARRIKDKTLVRVYSKYYDIVYQMVKIDYNELGAEGEIERDANGISFKHTTSRPSDEILSTIPQVL